MSLLPLANKAAWTLDADCRVHVYATDYAADADTVLSADHKIKE